MIFAEGHKCFTATATPAIRPAPPTGTTTASTSESDSNAKASLTRIVKGNFVSSRLTASEAAALTSWYKMVRGLSGSDHGSTGNGLDVAVTKNNITPNLLKEATKNKHKQEKVEKSNPKAKVVGAPDVRPSKSKISESKPIAVPKTFKQNAGPKVSSDKDKLEPLVRESSRTKIKSPRTQTNFPSNRIESSKEPKTSDDLENDDVDYEYEDDFEDYEDDFEDDISSKIDAEIEENSIGEDSIRSTTKQDIKELSYNTNLTFDDRKLMKKRIIVSRFFSVLEDIMSTETTSNERQKQHPTQQQKRPSSSRINFVSAEKTEAQMKVTAHVRRRYHDLKRILDLDYAKFDIYDCAPVRDYEFFMSTYGKSNRKQ
uniref:Uncharacterized protein n=1 Tax=Romanomermis culicivorax TaxID=13658 RepID=A0A915J3D9_ROMCU